jgi:hypothetical protein
MASLVAEPDWLNLATYRHLLEMDRAAFAWELLRRNPDYRLEAARSPAVVERRAGPGSRMLKLAGSGTAGRWGLLFP